MKPFQMVRLLTDKYIDEGIKKGNIGVILEDYDGENFEVEWICYVLSIPCKW